jgi:hypothetical protein
MVTTVDLNVYITVATKRVERICAAVFAYVSEVSCEQLQAQLLESVQPGLSACSLLLPE